MEAKLIWRQKGQDEDGFPIQEKQYSVDVFAEEKSVTRNEAYEAMRAGISVKIVLAVRQEDWEQTRHLDTRNQPAYAQTAIYDGIEYDIIRTYKVGKSMIELSCG